MLNASQIPTDQPNQPTTNNQPQPSNQADQHDQVADLGSATLRKLYNDLPL